MAMTIAIAPQRRMFELRRETEKGFPETPRDKCGLFHGSSFLERRCKL
jgi:hypothetical protein